MSIIRADLCIPHEHPCFEAHFPGNPIVPGALLLQWIVKLVKENLEDDVVGVKSMKFISLVKPGDQCEVHFERLPNNSSIKIRCTRGDEIVCNGVLLTGELELDG